MGKPKEIFISHSTKDSALADIIVNTAVLLGVAKESIFCSSYKGTDVKQQISCEVKEALTTSRLDIIILSNDYKQSAYCLNEAGVIWYKSDNFKMIISLPDIFGELTAGFLTTDYKQYRMGDAKFCGNFVDTLCQVLTKLGVIDAVSNRYSIYQDFETKIQNYMCQLPIIANISLNRYKETEQANIRALEQKAQRNIREMFNDNYVRQHQIPVVFYEYYTRYVRLNAIAPGKMEVETTTSCRLVNLSDQPYVETISSQFLKNQGGVETFSGTLKLNGKNLTPDFLTKEPKTGAYLEKRGPEITVKPHALLDMECVTKYQIAPERFFQSKLIKIPCSAYKLRAQFSQNFTEIMQQDFIFRFQVIPCVPRDFRNGVIPASECSETPDKHFVTYTVADGFPAGGGYVIAISKN